MSPSARKDHAPRLGVVAVGEELLRGDVIDTNGARLAKWSRDVGLLPGPRSVVGDDAGSIAEAIAWIMRESDVVAVLGGLGPTPDDVTRDGVARFLGEPLELRDDLRQHLEDLYRRRGMTLTEPVLRQAQLPRTASAIENTVGTAPGFWATWQARGDAKDTSGHVLVLPGPPRELVPMGDAVRSLLRDWYPSAEVPPMRTLQVAGYGESAIADRVARALGAAAATPDARLTPDLEDAGVQFATYLRAGAVEVRLWARRQSEAALDRATALAEAALTPWIYARDEPGLVHAIASIAERDKRTVAVAESCTGGLVGSLLASVPGASLWFRGGVIAYSEKTKRDVLGVSAETLATVGAVSGRCAEELARGALRTTGAEVAVSVTCFAGPSGGSESDPLGTTYLGWAERHGSGHWRRMYHGPRSSVRERAAWEALVLLWTRLRGLDIEG